jgi:hypothetical protein
MAGVSVRTKPVMDRVGPTGSLPSLSSGITVVLVVGKLLEFDATEQPAIASANATTQGKARRPASLISCSQRRDVLFDVGDKDPVPNKGGHLHSGADDPGGELVLAVAEGFAFGFFAGCDTQHVLENLVALFGHGGVTIEKVAAVDVDVLTLAFP